MEEIFPGRSSFLVRWFSFLTQSAAQHDLAASLDNSQYYLSLHSQGTRTHLHKHTLPSIFQLFLVTRFIFSRNLAYLS